jgi:peptide-methionine (S)-S-oxide reductase
MRIRIGILFAMAFLVIGCALANNGTGGGMEEKGKEAMPSSDKLKKATFAGGCFWCTEAFFQELEGVYKVTSGYIGGENPNPTYEEVCSGTSGHAEAVEIQYSPEEITFEELLEVHFKTHDPTTLNRQGADRGTQYRSAVFYHDEAQKEATEQIIKELETQKVYPDPIVTEVTQATAFFDAEKYHQDFYANNPSQGYCQAVISPKMDKFRKVFADKIRKAKAK